MKMCMCAVRLDGLPIQCPGMAKSLGTPLVPGVYKSHLFSLFTAWNHATMMLRLQNRRVLLSKSDSTAVTAAMNGFGIDNHLSKTLQHEIFYYLLQFCLVVVLLEKFFLPELLYLQAACITKRTYSGVIIIFNSDLTNVRPSGWLIWHAWQPISQ